MNLLLPILNRSSDGAFTPPADGWYHIVPTGVYPHPDSGTVQILDDKSMLAMFNWFREQSKALNFPVALASWQDWHG